MKYDHDYAMKALKEVSDADSIFLCTQFFGDEEGARKIMHLQELVRQGFLTNQDDRYDITKEGQNELSVYYSFLRWKWHLRSAEFFIKEHWLPILLSINTLTSTALAWKSFSC